MGLTGASTGWNAANMPQIEKKSSSDKIIALAGNPNVGKSTVFNALTGMKQHTGNWPGKTVLLAQGRYDYKAGEYVLVDLPGTYSLLGHSEEERVAAEFICEDCADCVVAVCDGTCLERSLNLTLQVLERTQYVVVCVNLMDEAHKQGIEIDMRALERELGVPVVGVSAGRKEGLDRLQERVRNVTDGYERPQPRRIGASGNAEQQAVCFANRAAQIAAAVVSGGNAAVVERQRKVDRIFVGRFSGIFIVLLLLIGVFWLTIWGANYPSALLERLFVWLGEQLWRLAEALSAPWWLAAPLIDGAFGTLGKVVSVMLPPIAIFFPLFTLLEDVGYLPRLAFLMDNGLSKCGACGKQALTTCMGFGCNAAGVVGCRIMDSPRERLIGILTNSFVPCNGRFPALITLSCLIFGTRSLQGALAVTGCVILGVGMSMAASAFVGKTMLRGKPSAFTLELPPYRRPNFGSILVRSTVDRTVYVLGRAAAVSAPAGLLVWLLSNVTAGGVSLLAHAAAFLEPVGSFLGMNGVLLTAFILAFPANELVLPVAVMILSGAGNLAGVEGTAAELIAAGWTAKTAVCAMVFLLFHWPCSTTVLTIYKETGKMRWTLLAVLLPTLTGVLLCAALNLVL